MSAPGRLAGLRRLADLAIGNDDPVVRAIGGDLALWLSRADDTPLERALGIGGEQSQRSARTIAGIESRNAWLRRGSIECGAAAGEMAKAMARFATINWPREGHFAECPARYVGRLEFYLWNAMKCWPIAVKARRLSSIIGNEQGGLVAAETCHAVPEKEIANVPTDERLKRRGAGS